MDADLTGSDLVDFLDAAMRGAWEAAAQIVIDAYGLDPDVVLELTSLDSIDQTYPPGGTKKTDHPEEGKFPFMWYRIIQRRPTGAEYGKWQPVSSDLVVSLGPRENEIEFSARPIARGTSEAVRCRCPLRSQGHLHRLAPEVSR